MTSSRASESAVLPLHSLSIEGLARVRQADHLMVVYYKNSEPETHSDWKKMPLIRPIRPRGVCVCVCVCARMHVRA